MLRPKRDEGKQDFLARCTAEIKASDGKNTDDAFSACVIAWDTAKGNRKTLHFSSQEVELAKGDGDSPGTFRIAAYTGKPIMRWGEKFVIDVEGIQARQKIPALLEHMTSQRVGYTTKTWAENHNFLVAGKFSQATPYGAEVQALAEDGYPWEASIGVKAMRVERLKTEKESAQVNGYKLKGPAEIWRQSKVFEVSFTNQGADDETAAISMTETDTDLSTPSTEDQKMNVEKLKAEHEDVYDEVFQLGAASVDTETAVQAARVEVLADATEAEKERLLGLVGACLGDAALERLKAIEQANVSPEQLQAVLSVYKPQEGSASDDKMTEMLGAIQAAGAENPGAGGGSESGTGDFEAEVQKLVDSEKMTRGGAIKAVVDKHPELHQAYLSKLRGDVPLQ